MLNEQTTSHSPKAQHPTTSYSCILTMNRHSATKTTCFTKISLHFVLNYSIPQSNFTTQSSLHQTANRVCGGWRPEPKQTTALNTKARNWSIATNHLVHDIQYSAMFLLPLLCWAHPIQDWKATWHCLTTTSYKSKWDSLLINLQKYTSVIQNLVWWLQEKGVNNR